MAPELQLIQTQSIGIPGGRYNISSNVSLGNIKTDSEIVTCSNSGNYAISCLVASDATLYSTVHYKILLQKNSSDGLKTIYLSLKTYKMFIAQTPSISMVYPYTLFNITSSQKITFTIISAIPLYSSSHLICAVESGDTNITSITNYWPICR